MATEARPTHNPPTVAEALRLHAKRLSLCSSTPRLDVEVLLAHVLRKDRAWLLAHANDCLPESSLSELAALVERRTYGEPVAYITGHREFYGLDLIVTPAVLVPRPETESLVDACLAAIDEHAFSQLADVGTGSGAILVAVGVNRPKIELYGTEISPEALQVAQRNCEWHGLGERTELYLGDLLEPLPGPVDLIAANLPYVPPGEASPDVAIWEPQVAVFGGGDDGTGLIRRFLAVAPRYVNPGGAVLMEVAHSQGRVVAGLAQEAFPAARVEVRKDLASYDRIVVVETS